MSNPEGDSRSPTYSIRVVSRLTGVSADTLRMWERRYGFPRPERMPNGNRVYTDDTLQQLILTARAIKSGFRPREVVGKSRQEVEALLTRAAQQPSPARVDGTGVLGELVDAIERSDVMQLRAKLKQQVAKLGAKRFVTEIVSPLVVEAGRAWAAGRLEVRHEHLMSEVLTTQLRALLVGYEEVARGPSVLLATLPHEQHRLGLEMAALVLAIEGVAPRLLGADSPADQIAATARAMEVDAVGLSITASSDPVKAATYVRWLLDELPPEIEIWAGGFNGAGMDIKDSRLHVVRGWEDLDALIEQLRDRRESLDA